MSEATDVSTLTLASVAALGRPEIVSGPNGRQFVFAPKDGGGFEVKDISIANAVDVLPPKFVTQHVKMQSAQSLIDYLNCFKNQDTKLFADIRNDTILGIIDYHREPTMIRDDKTATEVAKASAVASDQPTATLGLHRATLHLPKSLEWDTWNAASGKLMGHIAFATFLEENSIDIVNPPGADLLELCRDLQATQNVDFSSSVRMGDVTELAYSKKSDATDKGGVAMPNEIMLSIPVYFGEHPVSIKAFMRRKIEDGKLFLGVALYRAENVRQEEFQRIVDVVTVDTEHLTTVYGSPA